MMPYLIQVPCCDPQVTGAQIRKSAFLTQATDSRGEGETELARVVLVGFDVSDGSLNYQLKG